MHTDFRALLREHGATATAQRTALAEILFERPQHVCADDLLTLARERGVRVSKATVYNTLNLFARCGLVREVNVDQTRVYYDSTTRPHHHIYNMDTGELMDVGDGELELATMPELPEGTEAEGVEVLIRVRNRRS